MKNVYNNITTFLRKSIENNILWIISIFIVWSAPKVYFQWIHGNTSYVIYLLCTYFFFSFGCILFSLTKGFENFFRSLVFFCVSLYSALSFYCILVFNSEIEPYILEIIKTTNPQEVLEFCQQGLWLWLLVFLIIQIVYIVALQKCSLSCKLNNYMYNSLILLFAISFCGLLHNKNIIRDVFDFRLWEHDYSAIDLRKYEIENNLKISRDQSIDNIVVIIGESFSRNKSSLYGYEKETNPTLQKLKEQGNLFVFSSVYAPFVSTERSFKCILNLCNKDQVGLEWYKSPDIISILKQQGYITSWISTPPHS